MRPPGHLCSTSEISAGPQSGQRLELVAHELLRRAGERIGSHQLGVLDVALQPEPVGGAPHHRDAHARLVDVGDRLQRRVRRHQVRRLDLHVGRAERDLLRALRLGADQPDVPRTGLGRIGQLARRLERHELHRHAQPPRDLRRHVGRHAHRIAVRRLARHQQEILTVDAGAQRAGGRKLGFDFLSNTDVPPSFDKALIVGRPRRDLRCALSSRAPIGAGAVCRMATRVDAATRARAAPAAAPVPAVAAPARAARRYRVVQPKQVKPVSQVLQVFQARAAQAAARRDDARRLLQVEAHVAARVAVHHERQGFDGPCGVSIGTMVGT